jgi:hypothetical protein
MEDVSEPIFDLHFGLNWRKGKNTVGVGYSVFNTGKSFVFSNGPAFQNIYWDLEFTGFHLLYNRTIWKHFTFEPKMIYLWRGVPNYREKSMMTYSLSLYYNALGFGWKKEKEKAE